MDFVKALSLPKQPLNLIAEILDKSKVKQVWDVTSVSLAMIDDEKLIISILKWLKDSKVFETLFSNTWIDLWYEFLRVIAL